jgi:hypothetical protein
MLPVGQCIGQSNVSRCVRVYHFDLVIDPLNPKLVQSRRHTTIGVNPIVTQNNTVITLHIDDEECGSEQLAPNGVLHGEDAIGLHWVAPPPHVVQCQVGLHELMILSFKLLKHVIQHQVDGSAAVGKHPKNQPFINVTSNIQRLHLTKASSVGSTPSASRTRPPWDRGITEQSPPRLP